MTTSKPRTETPEITVPADQTFVLTHEEVSIACAEYVMRNRKNCRFHFTMEWHVLGTHNNITITMKHGHV